MVSQFYGISVNKGLQKILDKFAEQGASFIKDRIKPSGKSINDFVAFVYGGTGPAHCLEIFDKLGISKAYFRLALFLAPSK
ncbi:MAG: hypothetical protein QXQ63_04395 [Candidatus Bathyarchaeia archaeon]